ncbi:hypothetical protein GCM10010172_31680 [Paractinoplanes ferrugineus]|uniref:ARB-07466-like C-terminal domain-containing protein n=1 Tax=Paractinoplanes ferrugineus TaxID=113564 RepID=A0A919J442_9ACTN|nr:hypothetical protein [Actinoplanes ferrugineus]GIE14140.1 hypothetical protein Afe05nite_59800 [Actinoplanes ferrugineus]
MSNRVVALVVGAFLLVGSCLAGPLLLLTSVNDECVPAPVTSMAGSPPTVGQWDAEQLANARTIVNVGTDRRIPARGQIIALATAMQESGLHNLAGGDRDSVGLFQQRPSQGWGTPAQIADPVYAAGKFYDKLATIRGWQTMPLTEAAQAVQGSSLPNAYAKWEDDATALGQQLGAGTGNAADCSTTTAAMADPVERNPDGSWPKEPCSIRPDPTTGSGCLTPRTLHLVQQAEAAGFPKPGCYRVDDHGEHPQGRACDFMMTSGGEASGAQKACGDAMAVWAVANADRLGIKYVIWFRRIWTRSEGWHAYNNPFGGDDPSGWHTNHVHISLE